MVKKTNTPPLFSILLPTHNRAEVIWCSIESVLQQTVADFELLVMGDGCTDDTEQVVARYVKKDPRVKWFPFPKGKGFGYEHRNPVLKKARGKYVTFAAHDDLWFSDHLETLLGFFQKHPDFTLAYTRPLWIHPDGTIVPSFFNTDDPNTKHIFVFDHNEVPANCVAHTRKEMVEVGYCNAELPAAADWDLWRRIILLDKQRRIGFISTPTTLHFRANWRTETTSWDQHLRSMYEKIQASNGAYPSLFTTASSTTPLQHLVWDKVQKPTWIADVRKDAQAALDARLREMFSVIEDLKKTQLEKAEFERLWNTAQHDIQRISNTKGYRFLEWFRSIRRRFFV